MGAFPQSLDRAYWGLRQVLFMPQRGLAMGLQRRDHPLWSLLDGPQGPQPGFWRRFTERVKLPELPDQALRLFQWPFRPVSKALVEPLQ
ncbi:hypothetical protein [Mumia zhuanghuii]|uniref:Uncharacterized protein n=1 Tax=Mumia zhuanghuii TaxID=2585211 RepID=A0A5C4LUJ0_9ACTN|nr:hypothetical protein [Mumia zhuanghuii]TNC22444.1 hypothetical protein FHE65_35780 [Mumia zhuanghuii]